MTLKQPVSIKRCQTVNKAELGNLGLKEEEEAAIVAFLKTLTDDGLIQVPADKPEAPLQR